MITRRQRWKHMVPMLMQAYQIASNSVVCRDVPLARECWQYLEQHANFIVPLPPEDGEQGMEDWGPILQVFKSGAAATNGRKLRDEHDILGLIPLYQNDKSLRDPFWSAFLNKRVMMSYSPLTHEILLRMDIRETPRARAICLLHEAGHALRAAREGRAFADSYSRLPALRNTEELELMQMELDLLQVLGQGSYVEAIEWSAQDTMKKFENGVTAADRAIAGATLRSLLPPLDSVLGKMPDDTVTRENRVGMIRLHLCFRMCELLGRTFHWPPQRLQVEKLAVLAQVRRQ